MADVFDSVTRSVSIMAGKSAEMDRVAHEIAARVKVNAANDPNFAKSVKVIKAGNGKDRLIVATDPLAAPKELGHVVRNEPDGPVIGYAKGLRYMGRAVADTPEVTGD